MTKYLRLLRLPHARTLVVSAFVGRLDIPMTALALVLFVASRTGSDAHAGLAEGIAGAAVGVGMPLQGRVIDRIGASRVLPAMAFCMAVGWAAVVLIGNSGGPFWALLCACAFTGVCFPALGPTMRRVWQVLATDGEAQMEAAMALEGVTIEALFALGPLLAAGILLVASPSAVLLTAAALTLGGTLVFSASPLTRALGSSAPEHTDSVRIPVWRSGATIAIVATMLFMGIVFGAIQVGVPTFATRHGHEAIAGVALAVNAITSIVGGLIYGIRSWRMRRERRFGLFGALLALSFAPLVFVSTLGELVGLVALAGFFLAPFLTVMASLLNTTAPRQAITEAFGWLAAAEAGGAALGAAVAGLIAHGLDGRAPFLLAFLSMIVTALLANFAGSVTNRHSVIGS